MGFFLRKEKERKPSSLEVLTDAIEKFLFGRINIPALKKIKGIEGIYLVYEREGDKGKRYRVARYVRDNLFERESLGIAVNQFVNLSQGEFRDMLQRLGDEYSVCDFVPPLTYAKHLVLT